MQLEKRPDSTQELTSTIRSSILLAYEKVYASEGDEPPRRSGVTSDDYSGEMCQFIPDIQHLSKLPEGLILSFNLILFLAKLSYRYLDDGGSGDGNRASDEPIDDLLCDLSVKNMGAYERFPQKSFVDSLKEEAKMFDDFGIEGYLAKSIKMLGDFQHTGPSLAGF